MADTQDLFVERLNPDDARMYEFEGEWRQAEVVREEIQVKGRGTPEALDVTVTHHGPIVNEALGASEQPLALSWTGLQYPLLTDSGYRIGTARSGQDDHRAPWSAPRAAAQHAVGRPRRQHRLPARRARSRCARATCPTCPSRAGPASSSGTERSPTTSCPRVVNPPQGFIVTANNRIVGDDYPHHITSEWMTGYRARRIEELLGERERHSLDDFERMQHDFFSLPGRGDGAPALAPAPARTSARSARSSGSRAGTATSTPTPSPARSSTRSRSCSRRRSCAPRCSDDELVERWLNKSGVALFEVVSSPWRFQERLLDALGRGRPDVVRRRAHLGRRSRSRRSRRRSTGSRSGSAATRAKLALGPRPRRRVLASVRRRRTRSSGAIFNRSVEAGGASETVTQNGYLADRAVQGRVGARLPDAGRPRRPRAVALAAHDRAVRPARLARTTTT